MRAILTAAVAVGAGLLSAGAGRAGLYNTAEPVPMPVTWNFTQFRSVLADLRGAGVDRPGQPNKARKDYLTQAADLEAKRRWAGLTVDERVNLSACYLRLLRPEEAARVLEGALAEEPNNFMVLANLATANYLAGPQDPTRLSRAVEYQQQALKVWPDLHAGWSGEQLHWYRRAESYYLQLLQLRQQELRLLGGRPAEAPDDLFHVRFVGPSGRYEAGRIAWDQEDRLPLERVPLVEQLLLWLPYDNRLWWLEAELLNAQGDLEGADTIMGELVFAGYRPPELGAHRKVVRQAWEEGGKVVKLLESDRGPAVKAELAWMLRPRGGSLAPGAGALVDEAAWAAALDREQRSGLLGSSAPAPSPAAATAPNPAPPGARPASALPDWKTFLVGLISGAVIAALIGLQVRQTRARKGAKVG